jgi:hypothetical protein
MYLIRFSPQGGGSGLMMSTVFDGADGINVPSSAFYGSQPLSFDRDPRTGELHWIAHPKNVPSYAASDKFFRYVQHANGYRRTARWRSSLVVLTSSRPE